MILESLPERQEATWAHPEDTDTSSNHFEGSFYHVETGADKCHFGILFSVAS